MAKIPGLMRRETKWYLRVRVPDDAIENFGQREVWKIRRAQSFLSVFAAQSLLKMRSGGMDLNSTTLPQPSRMSMMLCSAALPLCITCGFITKSTPAAVTRSAMASHSRRGRMAQVFQVGKIVLAQAKNHQCVWFVVVKGQVLFQCRQSGTYGAWNLILNEVSESLQQSWHAHIVAAQSEDFLELVKD